jgi:hypothetical protein
VAEPQVGIPEPPGGESVDGHGTVRTAQGPDYEPEILLTEMTRRGRLPGKASSDTVFSREGEPALLIEEYSVSPGRKIRIEFEETNSAWRQGIFLGTQGLLNINGSHSPCFVLWTETALRNLKS